MNVLIADDDPLSRVLLSATLTRLGHDVVAVADGAAARDLLVAPNGPRMAILDWEMPELDGLDVCREARARATAYPYLILLTARDGHEDMVEGLDAGADDFLTKPFNANELRARLRSGQRVLELQASLLEAQEALVHHATIDHLTGLINRRMILEQLEHQLNRERRIHGSVSIGLVDIDHFKMVNDTWGHPAGDAVLRATAGMLRASVREYDGVGRFGGEEFLLVLPGCDVDQAPLLAERVRQRVAATSVVVGNDVIPVSVSIGLATTANSGFHASTLLASADEALYRAKAGGRNRVESGTAALLASEA
ncbi:MAG: diguanylate cyclase [Cytophagaceae bacterium]|nr:diguanylate cyclase [Gemmatimonadaceae bacterium]